MSRRTHDTSAPGTGSRRRKRFSTALVAVAALATTVSGCEVTNPGPIQDEFLNDATTHRGLVRGAERQLLIGSLRLFFASGTVTREIFPGGDTNSHSPRLQFGTLPSNEMDDYWNPTQQARFIAEDAIRRFQEPGVEVTAENAAQAELIAGFANKLLGENFCQIVIDGGEAQAPSVALNIAETHFTNAISGAANNTQLYAAYTGRAQTRIELGDWSGAVSDAAEVPLDFVYGIDADPAYVETRNFIAFANANENYRQYTYHFTYFGDPEVVNGTTFGTGYYTNTGDPRARWAEDPDFPVANASLPGYGNVPWSFDPDFPLESPSILARGTEMQLYRAEREILDGNYPNAMTLINEVRANYVSDIDDQPLGPLSAANEDEAGTILKDERMIDLHLEGRRFLDIRRWDSRDATPGDYYWPDWGQISTFFDDEPTSTCFPIPDSERDINPNLSAP